MDFCSSFLNNAFFGCYPNQKQYELLIEKGFNVFIDLTTLKERNSLNYVYNYDINDNIYYINYSIIDNKAPVCSFQFYNFLLEVQKLLTDTNNKLYLHCKGGHGRSSMVVACLLKKIKNYNSIESMNMTKKFHKERQNLKEKYQNIDTPQVFCQRNFVFNLFKKNKQ